jgi:hypothetical protein
MSRLSATIELLLRRTLQRFVLYSTRKLKNIILKNEDEINTHICYQQSTQSR